MGTVIIKQAEVLPGERLDNLANRLLGDPKKYPLLLEVNPELDIWDPDPGLIIEVPNA